MAKAASHRPPRTTFPQHKEYTCQTADSFSTQPRHSRRNKSLAHRKCRPADQNPEEAESLWTLQQFSEINGKPWLALREHNLDGTIQRQYTGTTEEIAALTAANNISPRQLPAVSEEHFYSQLLGKDRDYELGRQFAADPAQGIPHHLAPMDLDSFSAGMTDRAVEQQIRTENQLNSSRHRSKSPRPALKSKLTMANAKRSARSAGRAKNNNKVMRKAPSNPSAWRYKDDELHAQNSRVR